MKYFVLKQKKSQKLKALSLANLLFFFAYLMTPSLAMTAQTFDQPEDQQIVGHAVSFAADNTSMMVIGPLIDVHKGPGKGYPVMNTLEHGEFIQLLRQYTNWVQIQAKGQAKGWIHVADYQKIVDLNGRKLTSSQHRQLKSGTFAAQLAFGTVDSSKQFQGGIGYYVSEQLRFDAILSHISEDFLQGRQIFGQFTFDFNHINSWTPYVHMGFGLFDSDGTIAGQSQFDSFKFGGGVRRPIYEKIEATVEIGRDLILTAESANIHADTVRLGFITFF